MLQAIHFVLIPLLGGLLVLLSGKKWASYVALVISGINLVCFLWLMSTYQAENAAQYSTVYNWLPSLKTSLHLGIDGYSIIPLLLSGFVVSLAIFAAIQYKNDRPASYYALLIFSLAALNGFFTSQNPISFYLFYELALIPAYFLILQWGGSKRNQAVFKFFIYTVFGGFVMLAGIIFMAYKSNGNGIQSWHDLYTLQFSSKEQCWLLLAFFIAFAIKSPIFPFHTWQANLYAEGDKASIMIIAGVLSKMGVFGLLRFNYAFQDALAQWSPFLIALCIIGIIYGALLAWKQTDISRLLAYSSLSHMGMIAASVLLMKNYSVQGALFQMLVHGICASGLFFMAEILQRKFNAQQIDDVNGIARIHPRLSVYYFIIVLASIGLPLTAGFIGEFYMLYSLTDYNIWYGAIAAISIILGAVYMLSFYQKAMFGDPKQTSSSRIGLNLSEEYILLIIVFLVIALGFFPRQWMELSQYAFTEYSSHLLK